MTGGASPIYIQKPDLPLGGQPEDMAATVAALKADRIGFLHGLSQAVCVKEVPAPVVGWMWFLPGIPACHRDHRATGTPGPA